MASLRKKLKSPYWFGCFILPDGRRTQRSTKTGDRKLAMKLTLQWEQAAAKRITEAQARRVLSDIHEEIHGTGLASPSVSEWVAQWLLRKRGETAAVTYTVYSHAVEEFATFLGDKAFQPIHYVTPAQVATWRDAAARKASARTSNNKLKIVRGLFQSAWRDGLLVDNPAAKVQSLKTIDGNRRPFTIDELRMVLRVASPQWRGLVLAGLYTGQRLSDVASLTWANIDLEQGEVRLVTSKTNRTQIIPIANPLRAYLEESPAGDDPLAPLFPAAFHIAVNTKHVGALSRQFHTLLIAAGLAKPAPTKNSHASTGKGRDAPRERCALSYHSLRHTATSMLKNAGVSEMVARDLIGHESAEVSRNYTHVDEKTKREAIARLPDVLAKI